MLSVKENSDSQMTDCNTILDEPKHHSSKEITTSEMKLEIEVQTIENTTKIAPHSVVEIKDYTRAQIVTEELTQNIVENKLPYSCASCTKTFKTNRKLTVHVRTHTGEKPYSCIYCNKTFSQHGNMKRHEKNHRKLINDINLKIIRSSKFTSIARSVKDSLVFQLCTNN